MTYLLDIMMMVKVEEERSVQPLIKYLRGGEPLTDTMRAWLIKLLAHEAKAATWLKLVQPRGRRLTDDKKKKIVYAYERVRDLTNAKITKKLCDDIASGLKLKAVVQYKNVETRYSGRTDKIWHVGARFQFIEGKRLSHEDAYRIAALQYGLSRSYVKRIFRGIEKASR
jgi:hypothetical protein